MYLFSQMQTLKIKYIWTRIHWQLLAVLLITDLFSFYFWVSKYLLIHNIISFNVTRVYLVYISFWCSYVSYRNKPWGVIYSWSKACLAEWNFLDLDFLSISCWFKCLTCTRCLWGHQPPRIEERTHKVLFERTCQVRGAYYYELNVYFGADCL